MAATSRDLWALVERARIWRPAEFEGSKKEPPAAPGVYAWWFDGPVGCAPIDGVFERDGMSLLYVGICPSKSSKSKRTLRKRILGEHLGKSAARSTLRRTLGCLLMEAEGWKFQPVKNSTSKIWLGADEAKLTSWMFEHARVSWLTHESPWDVEEMALERLTLPLNVKGNKEHPYAATLKALRKKARQEAHASA